MELTEKQQFWKEHIEAADAFAGSQAEYARLHELDIKKFYFFKAALRDKGALTVGTTSSFVRVTQTSAVQMNRGVQVMLPNGVRLLLADLSQPGLLERLARL